MGMENVLQGEGLQYTGTGWQNPLYGYTEWWNTPSHFSFTQGNHVLDWHHQIANGINVPRFNLNLSSLSECLNAYEKCAPLQAVCNKIADAFTNGKWTVKNGLGDNVTSFSETGKAVVNLLDRPNPLMVKSNMLKQLSLNLSVFGGTFIYASVPSGFQIQQATSLWVFTPDEVEVVWKKGKNMFSAESINSIIKEYRITPKMSDTPQFTAKPEHVLFLYDTSENIGLFRNISDFQLTKGLKIKSLKYEIRNIMQAQEAIYSLNSDRGAQGIISNTAKDAIGFVQMSPEEKERLQNRFRSHYGMMRNQEKILITDSSVNYSPIGFNVRDLMLFEGVRENIMHLCDTFNYPFDLLSSEKGKTAADKRTSLAGLYQDNIIPLAEEIASALTIWFGLNAQDEKIEIDYSHLNIFQAGNLERNNSLRQLSQALHILYNGDMLTLEESRRMVGLQPELPNGTLRSETNAATARDDVRVTTS